MRAVDGVLIIRRAPLHLVLIHSMFFTVCAVGTWAAATICALWLDADKWFLSAEFIFGAAFGLSVSLFSLFVSSIRLTRFRKRGGIV